MTASFTRRARVAVGLAFVSLATSVVGAVGPSGALHTTYSWPPSALPNATPPRTWYAPLVLMRHRPEAITATIPCALPPALPAARNPVTVLATARVPERSGGLAVLRDSQTLVVKVKRNVLTRVDLPSASAGSRCHYELHFGSGRWSITGGPNQIEEGENLETLPFVSGQFSELDLRRPSLLKIEITTAVHTSRTTQRQILAWALAALTAIGSLLLVTLERRPRPWMLIRRSGRAMRAHARAADAFVTVVLLAWWVLSPSAWDDGWVLARQSGFRHSRGFSNYYDALGTNLPNGYWLEWLQHWIAQSSSVLLVLRVPALLCLFMTWVLCRWTLHRTLGAIEAHGRGAVWAAATAFLAGALAWGMTLRPEPIIALLVTGVLACAVAFREHPSATPLAVSAILVPLAMTGHHAGIVAFAPLVAVSPQLWRWTRTHPGVAATIAAASAAIVFVLASLGADIGQRLADARATRAYGISTRDWWLNEFVRYDRLNSIPDGVPLRSMSVALIWLGILAFVTRRKWSATALDIPGRTLVAALALLVFDPTKLPEHFGALMGITAIATGSESACLSWDSMRARRLAPRPFVVIAAAFLVTGWALAGRSAWNSIDLRTLDWRPQFETHLALQVAVPLVLIAILFGAALRGIRTGGSDGFYAAPWRVASWTAPIIVVPVIAFTVIVLVTDTVRTNSWTLARQNVHAFSGDSGCGLADDVSVTPTAARGSVRLADLIEPEGSRTLVLPNTLPYFPCARLPRLEYGAVGIPDYIITPLIPTVYGQPVAVRYRASPFYGLLDLYDVERLEWAGLNPPREIGVFAVERRIPGAKEALPARTTSPS